MNSLPSPRSAKNVSSSPLICSNIHPSLNLGLRKDAFFYYDFRSTPISFVAYCRSSFHLFYFVDLPEPELSSSSTVFPAFRPPMNAGFAKNWFDLSLTGYNPRILYGTGSKGSISSIPLDPVSSMEELILLIGKIIIKPFFQLPAQTQGALTPEPSEP